MSSIDVQGRSFTATAFDGTLTAHPSRYKISDDYALYPLVMPKGGKHWRFDHRFAAARRTFSIGPYPLFSLAEARDERDKARKLLRDDVLQRMEKERRAEATLTKTRWLGDLPEDSRNGLVRRLRPLPSTSHWGGRAEARPPAGRPSDVPKAEAPRGEPHN